ncbi:glycosyltransferase [Paraburkholderia sp. MMS20-SJTR3]|uniref:Glycosyltransferase n=1 Tax=Paraburkholderia sejongensis TaxID=2886946 RepID=A0ABS8JPG8_9BURK|nr:glycosyltransferase family 2 protein [Paraburkholderia sp. MMS20-SJTR3]MCC8391801.1 glycosyltransferase [Paraburkholderia sp. MMS20-SJTR3]
MQTLLSQAFLVPLTVTAEGALRDAKGRTPQIQGGAHWYVLSDAGTEITAEFGPALQREAMGRPDIGIFYVDQRLRREKALDLRPDFDLALLLAYDYIGLPIAVQANVLTKLLPSATKCGAAFSYAVLLEAVKAGVPISRIAEILATRDKRYQQIPTQDRQRVIEDWLGQDRTHFALKPGIAPYALQLTRNANEMPPVTLCIPTRQGRPATENGAAQNRPFITGLLETIARLDYPMDRLHVIVGDDLPDGSAYANRPWPFELTRIVTTRAPGEPFNYAKKMNQLWRLSQTEQVVLMNDDITSESTDWLQALLTFSMQEDVGGTGARLLYPNGTLQHAGMAGGLISTCAHTWLGCPADQPTYQDWAIVHREWSMVTGAVFATRRSVLEEINGFDEVFTLEFNDVDMCLRLKMLGYRIVYTPHAELVHHEKASRGETAPPGTDLNRFLKRWRTYLYNDPMFNPNLDRQSLSLRPLASA